MDEQAAWGAVSGGRADSLVESRLREQVLFLRPDDQGQIITLIASIAGAFPEQPPYAGRFSEPVPHLTVAEVSDDLHPVIEELAAEIPQLLPFQAEADAVTVMESEWSDSGGPAIDVHFPGSWITIHSTLPW